MINIKVLDENDGQGFCALGNIALAVDDKSHYRMFQIM